MKKFYPRLKNLQDKNILCNIVSLPSVSKITPCELFSTIIHTRTYEKRILKSMEKQFHRHIWHTASSYFQENFYASSEVKF